MRPLSIALPLLLCVVVCSTGCLGQRQEQEQKKRAAEQRLLERLDSSGRRVIFADQHGDTMGKWRLRRDHIKVYDEKLRPQGSVRIVRDKEGGFSHVEGVNLDGSRLRIEPVKARDSSRYSFGDRLMLEQQGEQWVLGQLDPFIILARFTPGGDEIRVQETRRNKNPIVRLVKRAEGLEHSARVEDDEGRLLWSVPKKVSAEQAVPFVLIHSSLSAMERAALGMFLDAHSSARDEPEPREATPAAKDS